MYRDILSFPSLEFPWTTALNYWSMCHCLTNEPSSTVVVVLVSTSFIHIWQMAPWTLIVTCRLHWSTFIAELSKLSYIETLKGTMHVQYQIL